MRRYSHDSSAPRHLRRLVDAGKRDDLDPLRRARVAASLGLVSATAMAMPSRPPPSPTLPPASGAIVRAMPRTVLGGIVIASVAVLGAGSWVSREVVSRESPSGETPSPPSVAANPAPDGHDKRAGEAAVVVPLPLNANAKTPSVNGAIADAPAKALSGEPLSGEGRPNPLFAPPSIDVSDLPAAVGTGGVAVMTTPQEAAGRGARGARGASGASARTQGAQALPPNEPNQPGEPSNARLARGSDRRAVAGGSAHGSEADKGATDTRVPSANPGANTGAEVGEKSAPPAANGRGVVPPVAKSTAKAGPKDPAKDPTKDVAKDTTNAGDLHEELAALDNVRRKTASGDPPAALALLDTYEKRFPTGKLREEALVLRIEALAANGQRESAERLAKTLFAASPHTPYATRVRAAVGRRSEEQQ